MWRDLDARVTLSVNSTHEVAIIMTTNRSIQIEQTEILYLPTHEVAIIMSTNRCVGMNNCDDLNS